jgi:ribosomal protein S18 acetylase RimI-like enzyme
MRIRAYDPARDAPALRACFIELQDAEHADVPTAPRGADIADAYLSYMWSRCARHDGSVFVAEIDGEVAGFVCLLARVARAEPDDGDAFHALLSELGVNAASRGRGVGRALIEHALGHAREHGASNVRLSVYAGNPARELYRRLGFETAMELMIRRLPPP